MRVHVAFIVHGSSFDDVLAKAGTELTRFAPNHPVTDWQVEIDIRPANRTVIGEITGWVGDVDARRSV